MDMDLLNPNPSFIVKPTSRAHKICRSQSCKLLARGTQHSKVSCLYCVFVILSHTHSLVSSLFQRPWFELICASKENTVQRMQKDPTKKISSAFVSCKYKLSLLLIVFNEYLTISFVSLLFCRTAGTKLEVLSSSSCRLHRGLHPRWSSVFGLLPVDAREVRVWGYTTMQ